jgi:sugar (pentulose or hexulose) kinase
LERLYLGIDLGTSACRIIALNGTGEIRAQVAFALPAPTRKEQAVEQAPALWWDVTQLALRAIFEQISARQVAAIAVDGTSGTLLLVDAHGTPLGPALMYNDGRCQQEAQRIAAVAPRTSAAHGVSSALAKLLYLQAHTQGARYALSQADWISAQFSGRYGVSDENHCLKLGLDPLTRRWPDWLTALGVQDNLLPQVLASGTPLGTIKPELAEEYSLPAGTLIVAGTTDSSAAFIATGASAPGEAVTSLGSTLVCKVISERPLFAPEHGLYSFRLGKLWLAGGGSNSGGAVLRRYFNPAQMNTLTALLRPDEPTGLDYYPLLAPGERFPVSDPHLQPRLTPRPSDDRLFFQGMLESMARIERQAYRVMEQLGAPYPVSLRSVGGGAANEAWGKIRAALLGVPLITPPQREAAYGSALLARRAA